MKRVIKFRGKNKETGEWLYGSLRYKEGEPVIYVDDIGGMFVEQGTVGQFTGLVDPNEKEVYEDDVLQYTYKSPKRATGIHPPVAGEHTYRGLLKLVEWTESTNGTGFAVGSEFGHTMHPVIGNIHDNPELVV